MKSYKAMSEEIDKLIDEDPNNPEVFLAIKKLIFRWLRTSRQFPKTSVLMDADIISTEMAGDIYMKILNEGVRVRSWFGYLKCYYQIYTRNYIEYNRKQHFNLDGDPEASYKIAELFSGSSNLMDFSQVSFNEIGNLDFLNDLSRLVCETVSNENRYISNSSNESNLKISLLISLCRGTEEVFRLPKSEAGYVKFLKNAFKANLIEDLKDQSESYYISEKDYIKNLFSTSAGDIVVEDDAYSEGVVKL